MLNIFPIFEAKIWQKAGIFLPRLQKKSSSYRFFCNLVPRFSFILKKMLFYFECK